MKVSSLVITLFVSYATFRPLVAFSAVTRTPIAPRQDDPGYCDVVDNDGCHAPEDPCCTDGTHAAICLNGNWFIIDASGGCETVNGTYVIAYLQ
jgi:hypothetical protein